MRFDVKSEVDLEYSLAPAVYNADTNGAAVDLKGYNAAAVAIIAGTVTDGQHTFVIEDSDDGVNFSAVNAQFLDGVINVVDATNDQSVQMVGYYGMKRYIRVVVSITGAITGGAYTAVVLKGSPRHKGVAV